MVHELTAERAVVDPTAVAVVFEGTQTTYADLDGRASRLAWHLIRRGVGPETLVGVRLPHGPDLPAALLAVWKAGGIYLAGEDLSGAALVIGVDVLPDDPTVTSAPAVAPPGPAAPDALAVVVQGTDERVMLTHRALVSRFALMRDACALTPGDRVLRVDHRSGASLWEVVWPLTAGAAAVMARTGRQADLDYLTDLAEESGVSILRVTPPALQTFARQDWIAPLSGVRLVVCDGDPLHADDVDEFETRHGSASVVCLHGSAEVAYGTAQQAGERSAGASPILRPPHRVRRDEDGTVTLVTTDEGAPNGGISGAPSLTPAEAALAAVWTEVLGLPEVGATDDFFALGGDSITSMQMVSRARRAGLELTAADVFEHPTVRALALVARTITPPARQADRTFPLTSGQRDAVHAATPVEWLVRTGAPVDPRALHTAVAALVAHHDALRLRLSGQDRYGFAASGAAADEAGGDGLDLRHGPVIRVRPAGGDAVLVTAHPFAVDAASWPILLQDLETAYGQTEAGRPVDLPAATASFAEWSGRRAALDDADTGPDVTSPLPRDHAGAVDSPVSSRSLDVEVPAGLTALLLDGAYGTSPEEALAASLALVLTEWAGGRAAFDVDVDGRQDLGADVSRTVGPFAESRPVVVAAADVEETLGTVREQLRRIPAQAPSGDRGVRLRHPETDRSRACREWTAVERSRPLPRTHPIELRCRLVTGTFRLTWAYSSNLYERATIERLAERQVQALGLLADHGRTAGGYTPSDFPVAGLDQATLDLILRRHGSPS
ncbi:AMP-binding protein [Microbispora sp. NPDC046973]|uniref:AMP-binding protein n=1 Tax=Microbispora sp. NPDC046973 TaxID=3155022 RepID=UPI0033F424A6